MNQPYATLTLASALREMFGVQLYKNNARALLLRILSILNLDWLQHARSVRGVYEMLLIYITHYFIDEHFCQRLKSISRFWKLTFILRISQVWLIYRHIIKN